ncbi:hypothetical protein Pr1d_46450 [Bythopirellula goksoeyrii]|uniref:Uncharacterized protein n=1 Tax=Bythopirellula goksoeyrii TaxID=1400387 RepID=A0A5B9QEC5_9BACT|nr:hypothetical protein Pr1d_46450 [Bythopirellula goksoeyrii]
MRCSYCGKPGLVEGKEVCPHCGSNNPTPETLGNLAESVIRIFVGTILGLALLFALLFFIGRN